MVLDLLSTLDNTPLLAQNRSGCFTNTGEMLLLKSG